MHYRILVAAAAAAAAVGISACGSSGGGGASGSGSQSPSPTSTSSSPSSASSTVKYTLIGSKKVLTNSGGFALYWFARDTKTASNCSGSCAHYWPPVPGPVQASGISGTFGTVKRSDGSVQATYDGYPVYTYIGDTQSGEATGNGLNLSGGKWYEAVIGGTRPSSGSSSSSSSGGGGY